MNIAGCACKAFSERYSITEKLGYTYDKENLRTNFLGAQAI